MLSESEDEDDEQDEEEEEKFECVICSQSAPLSEDSPVGLVCLVQRSTMLADHSFKARETSGALSGHWSGDGRAGVHVHVNLDSGANLHFQSCGHYIHVSCFNSYTETLNQSHSMREQQRIDAKSGLFFCPLCRQVGNALVPVFPKSSRREGCEGKRDASALLHTVVVQAETDAYLGVQSKRTSGRSPPIPLGAMGQVERGRHAGFGPLLSGAIHDFFARLVAISRISLDKDNAEMDQEGLEALIRGIGMTLGCMELCNRDPSAESLGQRSILMSSQERVLSHLRHLHQLTVCARRELEGRGANLDCGLGTEVAFVEVGQLLLTLHGSRAKIRKPCCRHVA
jgi:hypothetical protein